MRRRRRRITILPSDHGIPRDAEARIELERQLIDEAVADIGVGRIVLDHDAVDLARRGRRDGTAAIAGARHHQADEGTREAARR